MKFVKKLVLCVSAVLGSASVAMATPTPLEAAVESIEATGTSITGSAVSGAIIAAGLALFAIKFGVPWVMSLFKRVSK